MDTELAYLAGFFDGEGCVSIVRNSKTNNLTLTVSISQLNPLPLFLCQRRFGGSIHRERGTRGFRNRVSWQTASRLAVAALKAMRPYLMVKADEADVAIAYQQRVADWVGGDKDVERSIRMEMRDSIAAMKQRSYDEIELPKTERQPQDHSGPRLRMKPKPPKPKPPVRHRHKVAVPVISAQGRTGRPSKGESRAPEDAADVAIFAAIYKDHGPTEAAREYGVSRQTIFNWLDRYGIVRAGRTEASEMRRKAASAASWRPTVAPVSDGIRCAGNQEVRPQAQENA